MGFLDKLGMTIGFFTIRYYLITTSPPLVEAVCNPKNNKKTPLLSQFSMLKFYCVKVTEVFLL